MCDYSLENQISRAAEVGDKLVTSSFPMTPTRGFCAENEAGVAVCLLPGTELAFAEPVRYNGLWGLMVNYVKARMGYDMADSMLARFRQVDLDNPHTHHDAIELADGRKANVDVSRTRILPDPDEQSAWHGIVSIVATIARDCAERP